MWPETGGLMGLLKIGHIIRFIDWINWSVKWWAAHYNCFVKRKIKCCVLFSLEFELGGESLKKDKAV